jgi:hypothetical protein
MGRSHSLFISSLPKCMMVGPAMWAATKINGTPARAISSRMANETVADIPRPPYFSGQLGINQPRAANF